jgi:hypothetical protein
MRELPSRSSHVPVSISLDFCPAGCRVVHRSHGSLVFRWQGAVKDSPKGRRLWRSRSLTAPCRRKILIHALDGRGLDGRLIVRRCLLAPRVGKGPVARRGAKGAARCIILYRLSRMMRGFVRRARPIGIGFAGGDHPSMPRLSPASPSPARAFSASRPPPPGGRRVCRLSRMMRGLRKRRHAALAVRRPASSISR